MVLNVEISVIVVNRYVVIFWDVIWIMLEEEKKDWGKRVYKKYVFDSYYLVLGYLNDFYDWCNWCDSF